MVVYVIDFSSAAKNALNPFGSPLCKYVCDQLEEAKKSPQVTSVVLTGGLKNFSAGADISEFDSPPGPGSFSCNDVVKLLDDFPKPTVAAMAGNALGGGLEVTLACHYRVCTSTTRMGLPEVTVGVLPGGGGTQRLPRLIGLATAVDRILTAKPLKAKQALELGLVDAVVDSPQELLATAEKWAEWAELMPLEDRRVSTRPVPDAHLASQIAKQASKKLAPPEKGGFVHHCALKAVMASATTSYEQGKQIENKLFIECLKSVQGMALRHAFFSVRKAQSPVAPLGAMAKHPLLQKNNKGIQVAVIGAGTMGSGIALVLMQAGFAVTLVDIAAPALEKGVKQIHKIVQGFVAKKRLSAARAKALLSQLSSTQKLEDLTKVQLVVEAVVERTKIKKSIFSTLDKVTPPNCILLSNTSTLDIDEMASVLSPQRQTSFAGWHFFSPAHVMKLVEIVKGKATSTPTVVLLQALTKRIQKLGVVVGNCYGFCGNRLLKPYGQESAFVLAEGGARTPQVVDKALTNFGMAMGVFTMGDLAGNDIEYNIRRELGFVRDPKTNIVGPNRPKRYSELGDDIVAKLGRLGQKAGKGWYDYDPSVGKGRKPIPSKEVEDFIAKYVPSKHAASNQLSQNEIIARAMFPLVNEGFKCLEEGIAQRPSDIDIVYLNGYGWPVWRGGPMFWADNEVGLPTLLETLQRFSKQFPDTEHFVPSKLLVTCVKMGVTVGEYYAKGMHKSPHSRL